MIQSIYEHHYGVQDKGQIDKLRACISLKDADEQITVNYEKIIKDRVARHDRLAELADLAREINNNAYNRKKAITGKK